MIREALEFISELTKSGQTFQAIDTPDGKTRLIVYPDGSSREFQIPPTPTYTTVADIASFLRIIKSAEERFGIIPRIFISCESCFAYLDERNQYTVRLPLGTSRAIAAVESLRKPNTQQAVVNTLRDLLSDAIEPGLLPSIRSMSFTRRNDGAKNLQHGRESLGKSVENAIQSQHGEIPEQTRLTPRFFANVEFSDFRADIAASIELSATNETIAIIPQGEAIEDARHRAQLFAADVISGELAQAGIEAEVIIGTIEEA